MGVVIRRWVWLVGGMYGCGYQEVGVVGRSRVWLAGGMYGCGYQEVGVVGIYWCGLWVFSSYNLYIPTALVTVLFCSSIPTSFLILLK